MIPDHVRTKFSIETSCHQIKAENIVDVISELNINIFNISMAMTCPAFSKNNHDLKSANVDICLTYISDQENSASWYKTEFLLKWSATFDLNQKYEIFFTHQHAREYHCHRKSYEML